MSSVDSADFARLPGGPTRQGRQTVLDELLFRVTRTTPLPASTDQTSVSPASTPSIAATGAGTVVRTDADRGNTRTALDSNGRERRIDASTGQGEHEPVGQLVGQHRGQSAKYIRAVGQHVGRQMVDTTGTIRAREARALDMLHSGMRVAETSVPGEFIVASQSGSGFYRVTGVASKGGLETCTCPDFEARLAPCKHIHVVRLWLKAANATTGSFYPPPKPRKQKINWPLYNEAKVQEDPILHVLLRDLCLGVAEPARDPHAAGRPPIPLRDQAFCAVQRSYFEVQLRESTEYRIKAASKGQLSAVPHWAVASRFLCRDDVTDVLRDLLARSAFPLVGIEDRCAIDSTGLRTTRFHYYRKEKYDPSRENLWLKMHALALVKSHAIPVLEVTTGSVADSPQFPILLKRAHENGFRFKEVLADRGYQSRANFNAAAELDILPFIPFKSNQTGQSKGSSMYHKMYLFF